MCHQSRLFRASWFGILQKSSCSLPAGLCMISLLSLLSTPFFALRTNSLVLRFLQPQSHSFSLQLHHLSHGPVSSFLPLLFNPELHFFTPPSVSPIQVAVQRATYPAAFQRSAGCMPVRLPDFLYLPIRPMHEQEKMWLLSICSLRSPNGLQQTPPPRSRY